MLYFHILAFMKTGNGLCIPHLLFLLIFCIKTADKNSCTRAEIVLLNIHLVTSVLPKKLTSCFKYKSFLNFLYKTKKMRNKMLREIQFVSSVSVHRIQVSLSSWSPPGNVCIPSQLWALPELEDSFNLVRKVSLCSLGFLVGFCLRYMVNTIWFVEKRNVLSSPSKCNIERVPSLCPQVTKV